MSNDQQDRKSLEYWLARATDPFLPEAERPQYVNGFCEQMNDELEGPQIATRLLSHKIQSPQEKEALLALEVMEACVKHCGARFHNELGKFRFLNEIIKILSPKYLGLKTPERVRTRAIELLYSWAMSLRHLPKIRQAYEMLKHQGVVKEDPKYMDEILEREPPPDPPKPRLAPFEDAEKAKLLSSLLSSKNPEDLQAANRLIKSMVKEEEKKHENAAKRENDLKSLQSNSRLLLEMLANFNSASQNELETMKDICEQLVKMRPTLFRYASEATESSESALTEILSINDEVGKAIDDYKSKMQSAGGDLLNVDFSAPAPKPQQNLVRSGALGGFAAIPAVSPSASDYGVDDVSLLGSLTPLNVRKTSDASGRNSLTDLDEIFGSLSSTQQIQAQTQPLQLGHKSQLLKPKGLNDLDLLSQGLIQQNLPPGHQSQSEFVKLAKSRVPLKDIPTLASAAPSLSPLDPFKVFPGNANLIPPLASLGVSGPQTPRNTPNLIDSPKVLSSVDFHVAKGENQGGIGVLELAEALNKVEISLDDLSLTLDEIQPSNKDPVEVIHRDKMSVLLLEAENRPVENVRVFVASISSQFRKPVTGIRLLLKAESSDVEVRQMAPTGDQLPPFNPLAPSAPISEIIFVRTEKNVRKISLDFEFCYRFEGQEHSVKGSLDLDLD